MAREIRVFSFPAGKPASSIELLTDKGKIRRTMYRGVRIMSEISKEEREKLEWDIRGLFEEDWRRVRNYVTKLKQLQRQDIKIFK